MSEPSLDRLFAVIEATWPPAETREHSGWHLRRGAGGGKRVSAASAIATRPSISDMEAAQAKWGQQALVMIRAKDADMDAALHRAGYEILDRTRLYLAPTAAVAKAPPRLTGFLVDWPALGVQRQIWEAGGIGPARIDVMDRANGPRVGLLGRANDAPVGAGFAAGAEGVAMVHALEVLPRARRQGLARNMMRAAAVWAQQEGLPWLSVLVTEANAPANALYCSLGMRAVGQYHYRCKRDEVP